MTAARSAKPGARAIAAGPSKADFQQQARRKLMIAIRAACRRLGLDEDCRRETQLNIIGIASMAQMSNAQLGALLDHFNRGWKGPMGHRAYIGKIRALWWSLYWLGALDQPQDHAIDAFVRRQTGTARLAFLDHVAAHSVIEALKSWAQRSGVIWLDGVPERECVLAALARGLDDLGFAVELPGHGASPRDQDLAIAELGKMLRSLRRDDAS